MARSPVLTSSTLSPFGGGGGGFGAFSIVNPGREAYLTFLKTKIDWQNGQVSNAEYLAAYEVYVGKQKEGSSTRLEAQQGLDDTRYKLERNDLMAQIEAGTRTWTDLVEYDKGKLAGLDHASQEYADRLDLYQASQAKELNEAARDQHDLYEAGKITTAQLRSWYMSRAGDPDLALNPDLAEQIGNQVSSLDLRLTSEADSYMIQLYRDGKVGVDAFLTYATTAKARYGAGTEDGQKWDQIITDAKAKVAERGLTYRYGLSQDYIQLQKFIKSESDMLARAGSSSTSTSQRIVLGANGEWKVVTSTKSTPYKPSAAEQKAMRERRIELADAQRQLAEWTQKIKAAGGFVTTDQMIGFYGERQAGVVKGTDEWYQLQERLDGLQQQKHTEQVLAQEGVRISFNTKVEQNIKVGGGSTGGGGGGSSAGSVASSSAAPKAGTGPLEIITGNRNVGPGTDQINYTGVGGAPRLAPATVRSKFPTNLDGSAFQKFYSGFVAAYKDGATAFTDYSSGKPVTYYIPEDLTARAEMVGNLDDLRISYYATRAQVYAGTPSEFVAAKEYSDAIKDKADNAYLILITSQKGGAVLDPAGTPAKPQPYGGHIAAKPGPAILDPIEQGLKVKDQAKAYYAQQVKLAKESWSRGDVTGAWAHLQLATRTAAETEAKMGAYLDAASSTMSQIYAATGQVAPDKVTKAFEDLADWQTDFDVSKKGATELAGEVFKWVKLGPTGQPAWNADGTLSLHDGAALFLTPDGQVSVKEVPSAGYAQAGGQQQVPDVPGHVRVTVNLGGTVPAQTVYAPWTIGTVGFTADGKPIQGKVVSGFANGQRYTLTEDPFHPGKWSLGNQTFKVPPGFGTTETDGVYQFSDGRKNYLLMFDPKAGRYVLVTPGTAFSAETRVPLSEADAQAKLAAAGFGTDLSVVSPDDRWKYNLSEPFAGFTKDQYQKFTTPPPGKVVGIGGMSPDERQDRNEWLERLRAANSSGSPDERDERAAAKLATPTPRAQFTGIPFAGMESTGKPRVTPIPPSRLNQSGSPDERDELAAMREQTIAATSKAADLKAASSLDAREELLRENKSIMAIKTTLNLTPKPAPVTTTTTTTKTATPYKTPAPTIAKTTTKKATTMIAPIPKISTTKVAALTKLA